MSRATPLPVRHSHRQLKSNDDDRQQPTHLPHGQRVGYIAVADIAAVTAKVLRDGPEKHASKNYYLSTETMTGPELAIMLSEVLGRRITCDVRHPADMEALFKAGGLKVEDWYARSSIEFCTQLADGRLGYFGTVRDDIPYLLGRPGTSFRAWATAHRAELLDLVDQRAGETPTE